MISMRWYRNIINKLNTLMETAQQVAEQIDANTAEVKANTAIVNKVRAEIQALKEYIESLEGKVSPVIVESVNRLAAAVAEQKPAVQAADDENADPEPPSTEEPTVVS